MLARLSSGASDMTAAWRTSIRLGGRIRALCAEPGPRRAEPVDPRDVLPLIAPIGVNRA